MKERIKSFVLVALIFLGVGLTSITWVDERLWPDGYSLFVNVREWPLIRNFFKNSYSLPMENLSKARKIVIADGMGTSAVFYNGDRIFDAVYEDIDNLLLGFLSGETEVMATTHLTKENVRELLNEQVMYAYINYSVAMPPSFFGQLMGVAESDSLSSVTAVRDFFLLPTGEDSLELLAIDSEKESVMRYELSYGKTSGLIEKFTEYVSGVSADNNCVMALQMNMDKASPDDAVQMKTLLDSFLVLDSASTAISEKAEIVSKNPVNSGEMDAVVSCFSFNPASIYRYVDSFGTVVYLENDSSLKIYKNGLVEYEALDVDYGIPLSGGKGLYESLNSAIRFAGKVYSSAVSESEFTMNVASDIMFSESGEMNFSFDYYHEGTPISTDIDTPSGKMEHAAEITVAEGKIKGFKMLLREYKETGKNRETMNIYGAIDKVALKYEDREEPVKIDDMFLAYKEDGLSETLVPLWVGYAEGKRIIIQE